MLKHSCSKPLIDPCNACVKMQETILLIKRHIYRLHVIDRGFNDVGQYYLLKNSGIVNCLAIDYICEDLHDAMLDL